jgi:hypothetical protein
MEPHRKDQQKALEPGGTPKPKRFRIVKLEERIAPSKGPTHGPHCGTGDTCGSCPCNSIGTGCTACTCLGNTCGCPVY